MLQYLRVKDIDPQPRSLFILVYADAKTKFIILYSKKKARHSPVDATIDGIYRCFSSDAAAAALAVEQTHYYNTLYVVYAKPKRKMYKTIGAAGGGIRAQLITPSSSSSTSSTGII
ncbi:unnamed protein product [Trichogramma brassicae]|uniref:Uncharacterized protein n=1 Tax=Trichogramma brassicae TaxID=86971 RepID=A0A6H5IFF6_9HYME|nr:unnamed protein product [Trichogramma brassicae]